MARTRPHRLRVPSSPSRSRRPTLCAWCTASRLAVCTRPCEATTRRSTWARSSPRPPCSPESRGAMTLLWDADPAAKERYDFAVGEVQRYDNSASMVRGLEEYPTENLIVIGPDVDMDSACQFTEFCRVERPELGVLLLRRRLDVAVLA